MSIRQVPFESVFDGTANFAPKAIVLHSLQAIVARHHLSLITDNDGLDVFSTVPMLLDVEHGVEVKFALWRHRGNPENTFAIHLALPQLATPGFLDRILKELEISDQAVLWKAPDSTDPQPLDVGSPMASASFSDDTIGLAASAEELLVPKATQFAQEISTRRKGANGDGMSREQEVISTQEGRKPLK